MPIHQLSENLTNQIAAGEVIERPASVVKELVENSIDAGADRIMVSFADSGLKEITVQDNGTGIASDQLDLAFMRHATSKINNERDLFNVATLGFRGEALASIAAVSHVEITTAVKDAIGTRAVFSGGVKKSQEDAASINGTTIKVRDLFFNTPARLKYLRSPRTEMMKIVDIINRLALGYPDISFTLKNEKKTLLRTTGNGKLDQTVANVYGRHLAEKMIAIQADDADFKISGLISKPELTRSSRNFISILLNGRYIRNFKLNSAIMEGYGNKLSPRHYPVAVIRIQVDPLLVDVNVHPTKQEVRLSKEKELGRLITTAISGSLLTAPQQVDVFADKNKQKPTLIDQLKFNLNKNVVNTKRSEEEVHEPKKTLPVPDKYVDLNTVREDDRYVLTASWDHNVDLQTKLTPFNSKIKNSPLTSTGEEVLERNLPDLQYLAALDRYLLAQNNGDLYLIDQVAARQKLVYQKTLTQFETEKMVKQSLLTPIVLEFGNLDFLQIKDQLEQIKKLGIELEDFGQDSFILRSYPTWIKGDVEKNVRQILDLFLSLHQNKDNLFAQVAKMQAQSQIKMRYDLTDMEASNLIAQLSQMKDPYYGLDGKVVIVRLSQNELRKMFEKK